MSLLGLSCDRQNGGQQLAKDKTLISLSGIYYLNNSSNNLTSRFLFGNKFRITHESYGCFHYNLRYIDIEENNGIYSITLKEQFSNRTYSPVLFDSSFATALDEFNIFYSQLLDSKAKTKSFNNLEIGTVNKLTIGGFSTNVIFCDNYSELSGFNKLITIINSAVAKKTNNS